MQDGLAGGNTAPLRLEVGSEADNYSTRVVTQRDCGRVLVAVHAEYVAGVFGQAARYRMVARIPARLRPVARANEHSCCRCNVDTDDVFNLTPTPSQEGV